MKVKILIIAFLCAQFIGFSQKRKVERLDRDKTPSLKLGYSSRINFNNPGVNIGAEFMMRRKTVTKRYTRTKEKFLVANLSFFDEPDLYNNASLTAEWLKRTRYGSGGFFTEMSAGFGVGRIINYVITPTYVKNPDGTESIKKSKKDFIMLSFNAGLGYDFMPKMQKPIKAFARLSFNPIYYNAWPYGGYLKSEIGVIASLSAFKKK
jgi:hypothetical protein